jgi:pimeloyl-ACP methyl ester carboxylesterase
MQIIEHVGAGPPIVAVALLALGCGSGAADSVTGREASPTGSVRSASSTSPAQHHVVPVRDGVALEVLERTSDAAEKRSPSRAVLMLPGALSSAVQYDAPEESPLARAARAGFYAFAVSYEGCGASTHTVSGDRITPERMAAQVGDVVEWIRRERGVDAVDLIGSSLGSNVAVMLGGVHSPIDRTHIHKIVLTAFSYETVAAPVSRVVAACSNASDGDGEDGDEGGFITTDASTYAPIVTLAEPRLANWLEQTLPGLYPVGPVLAARQLPLPPASDGRAPALEVWGQKDELMSPDDVNAFQGFYGGPADLLDLPDGGHVPYYEEVRAPFWESTLAFLDS